MTNEEWKQRQEALKAENDWRGILQISPTEESIDRSLLWNDPECLNDLAFVLGKIDQSYPIPARCNPDETTEKRAIRRYFVRVNDRCLALCPDRYQYLSARAYFHYNHCIQNSMDSNDELDQTISNYRELTKAGRSTYQDRYRLCHLLTVKIKTLNIRIRDNSKWPEINKLHTEVRNGSQMLIDEWRAMPEDENKKKLLGIYAKCLYHYVRSDIENVFDNYYDAFFAYALNHVRVPAVVSDNKRAEEIKKCDEYLHEILTIIPADITRKSVEEQKPTFLDVKYRLSLISVYKAAVAALRGFSPERYARYLGEAIDYAEQVMRDSDALKRIGARFNQPWYVCIPWSFALHCINKLNESEQVLARIPEKAKLIRQSADNLLDWYSRSREQNPQPKPWNQKELSRLEKELQKQYDLDSIAYWHKRTTEEIRTEAERISRIPKKQHQ